MRRLTLLAALLAGGTAMAAEPPPGPPPAAATLPADALDKYPHTEISNGVLTAQVFAPDENEMYRGTRFDHAGVVVHATYRGQDYGQYWFDRFVIDPADNNHYAGEVQNACRATSGPMEEFAPVGFGEVGIAGRFLKIGVGIVQRDTREYSQFPQYAIIDAGRRTVKIGKNSARFTQAVHDDLSGYGYDYVKMVTLVAGQPRMTITHKLTNTGTRPIDTTVYCHNFLSLSPGNENITLAAPFDLAATQPLAADAVALEGKTLRYLRAVKPGESVYSFMTGFGTSPSDYDFTVTNTRTGFGQRIRADQPLAKLNFWSMYRTFSWEPYIAISLKPGESKSWTYTYDYFGPQK